MSFGIEFIESHRSACPKRNKVVVVRPLFFQHHPVIPHPVTRQPTGLAAVRTEVQVRILKMRYGAVAPPRRHADTFARLAVATSVMFIALGGVVPAASVMAAKSESSLRVGNSVNVFVRYGYLSISMKVISYNDTERWLFKEPTNQVFRVSLYRGCW